MLHILIAEDESRISAFIEKGLKASGFLPTTASNAVEAVNLAQSQQFALMILDLGLPGKDGLQVLEELRGQGVQLPIIILTARSDLHNKLAGLEGGADDYMSKPFSFEELLARVRLRLRSPHPSSSEDDAVLRAGEVTLNLRTRRVMLQERVIELPSREFTLAETFFRHPGQVFSREQLLDRVWGYDYDPSSNVVDVYVGYLRKKLGSHLIETVRGAGYRLKG